MRKKPRKTNAYLGLVEPLMDDPGYLAKAMFGCEACYLDGRLMLVLADGEEPWNGILVVTAREHHGSLRAEFPTLGPHAILGKWLYVSARRPEFEWTAQSLVELALGRDARIGIEPKPRKVRRSARRPAARTARRSSRPGPRRAPRAR